MRRTLPALLALVIAAGCSTNLGGLVGPTVTGSGVVKSESREIGPVDAVTLSGIGELTITQGDAVKLTVEAEDNILPLIETETANGKLTLGLKSGTSVRTTKPIKYQLTVKTLKGLELSGSGSAASAGLKTDRLNVVLSGSGGVTLDRLEADELTTVLSGSGSVKVTGKAPRQKVTLSGSGAFQGGDLDGRSVTVNVTGSGRADVRAGETLDATVTGSGSIGYRGDPKVSQSITGSGRVTPLSK